VSQRFYVYPLFFVALTQLVPLLRHHRRWHAAQIAQLFLITLASAGACCFEEDFSWVIIAWTLFLVFIAMPRVLLRLATRVMWARSLADGMRLWRWAGWFTWGQLGRLYRAHAAVLKLWADGNQLAAETLLEQLAARSMPDMWHSEVLVWRLTLLTVSRQRQQAVAFYESGDTWGTLASATQARLLVARSYAELGDFARAQYCLQFVSLSPRTIGALETQLQITRVCVAALAGDSAELEDLLRLKDSFPRRRFARFAAYWRGRCALVRGDREEARRQLSRALALTNRPEAMWRERIEECLRHIEQRAIVMRTTSLPAGYLEGREALRFAEQQSAGWRALMHVGRPKGMTLALIFAFALVFLVDQVVFEGILHEPLWLWAGNMPESVRHGEWWRLFTALFLHANPLHLAMNGATLWLFGTAVEKAIGRWRLLVIFLVAGVLGNVWSVWHAHYDVSVGASGGIFGIIGAFAVAVYQLKSPMYATVRRRLLALIALAVASDLTIGWLEPQIDNLAHAGGFVAGLVLAIVLAPRHNTPVVDWPRVV
jgi:membrane associated rhomboid family serine protease/predicted negative regulator of RcsB-dependent stress response